MNTKCNGLLIDLSRDNKFDKLGKQRLRESYMMANETSPQERFAYVCSKMGTDTAHAQRLYEYVSHHWLSLSTPILSYGKAKHGLPISCYLSYMADTSDGLLDTLLEVNQLSMLGGGVGVGIGIRTSDNKSTGVMPHINTYDASCLAYKQDGVRRGSYAMYLDIDHPEIIPFLDMRKPTGDHNIRCLNLHHGINVSDKFMKLIELCIEEGRKGNNVDDTWNLIDPHSREVKGKVSARDLWQRILETRMKTGEPYLCFIDTCNRGMYDFQKEKGLSIKQSNLCVAPETLILTKDGQYPIKELEGKMVKVWNGDEFSEVTVVQTGTEKELVDVELSNGSVLTCTPEHKFITVKSYNEVYNNKNNNRILNGTRIDAQDLKKGMKLIKFDLPVVFGNSNYDIKYPYTHGFFCGDGTYTNKGHPQLSLYGEKMELLNYLNVRTMSGLEDASGRLNTWLPLDLSPKFEVPINSSLECRMEWLAGYFDADGCVARNGTNEAIQVACINLDFLKKVQLLLIGMGVTSKITKLKEERDSMLPDGKGGQKLYSKEIWRIMISSSGLYHLSEQGFETHRLKWEPRKPQRSAQHFVTVVKVTRNGRVDDTYCFTEPLNHAGIFNGILTGQCTEIILPTDSERTAVCCLSSVNLECYDEWKDNSLFIKDFMEMLDNALSIFIEKSPSRIHRAKNSALKERSIGIGVLGFHALLQQKNVAFGSDEASEINHEVFKELRDKINIANLQLGSLRGSPEDAQGTGRRFCCTMAIAPTATSSIIMGNTSPSVEPFRANAYRQDTMSGSFLNKNKYLKEIISKRLNNERDEDRVWSHIVSNDGSVQQLPSGLLSIKEKDIFKTAFEIDQTWVVKHAADRQQYIDQSQSINLFIPPNVHVKQLHSLHYNAWKKGLKTLYYLRSIKISEADKISSNHVLEPFHLKENEEMNGYGTCKLTNVRRSSGCFACE
jgi:ribonucleoside-diphosphate reductase alpha chain